MTVLHVYVIFGVPAIALALALGGLLLLLQRGDFARLDRLERERAPRSATE